MRINALRLRNTRAIYRDRNDQNFNIDASILNRVNHEIAIYRSSYHAAKFAIVAKKINENACAIGSLERRGSKRNGRSKPTEVFDYNRTRRLHSQPTDSNCFEESGFLR